MTSLINQISINGKTTTFLNYVNPLSGGKPSSGTSGGVPEISDMLTTHFGTRGGNWNRRDTYFDFIKIRFPVPWETLSGSVGTGVNDLTNARIQLPLGFSSAAGNITYFNTNNSTGTTGSGFYFSENTSSFRNVVFGVVNNYAMCIAGFSSTARTSVYYCYGGWAKDPQFSTSGPERVRNLIYVDSINGRKRVTLENSTNAPTDLTTTQPTLSCQIATTGANSSDLILRDSASPNNYIGKLWHVIRLPASAQVGKIYKNTGVDPDTGVVETDQKAFWMCIGSYGSEKIGMRVWTEGIT